MRYFKDIRKAQAKLLACGLIGLAAMILAYLAVPYVSDDDLFPCGYFVFSSALIIVGSVGYPQLRSWSHTAVYVPSILGILMFLFACVFYYEAVFDAYYYDSITGTTELVWNMHKGVFLAVAICALTHFVAYWHTRDMDIKAMFGQRWITSKKNKRKGR